MIGIKVRLHDNCVTIWNLYNAFNHIFTRIRAVIVQVFKYVSK